MLSLLWKASDHNHYKPKRDTLTYTDTKTYNTQARAEEEEDEKSFLLAVNVEKGYQPAE